MKEHEVIKGEVIKTVKEILSDKEAVIRIDSLYNEFLSDNIEYEEFLSKFNKIISQWLIDNKMADNDEVHDCIYSIYELYNRQPMKVCEN